MGMEPDMMEESQFEGLEATTFVKTGLRTGRQALMIPRMASMQASRETREYICWELLPEFWKVTRMRVSVTPQMLRFQLLILLLEELG